MHRRNFLTLPALVPALLPTVSAAPAKLPSMDEKISVFGLQWQVISAADWKIDKEGASETLHLVAPHGQEANPRRPVQFALAETDPLSKFTMELEVKRPAPKNSLILVYAWQKAGRFNYVHLSDDAPMQVNVHNGIFHCFDGDRVRISPLQGPAALPTEDWQKVKVTYDASQGLVQAWVNGQTSPCMKGIDLSLAEGRIGLGSFFNTGSFRNFKLTKA